MYFINSTSRFGLHHEETCLWGSLPSKTVKTAKPIQLQRLAKKILFCHIAWTVQSKGSYRQVCVKFKDFSRTSKILSYCFQELKTYANTDLQV